MTALTRLGRCRARAADRLARGRAGGDGGDGEGGEGGFALIYVALIMLVIASLSVAMLALLVNQVKPTQFARKSAQTLNDSEAGFDAALSVLRGAITSPNVGSLSALPQCQTGSRYVTLSGTLGGVSGYAYSVNVYYLQNDPSTLSLADVQAKAMTCDPLKAQPLYAYLISNGTGPALPSAGTSGGLGSRGNRTLHAAYQFNTSNLNVTGGRILQFPQPGVTSPCWTRSGTTIVFKACGALGTPIQSWIYRSDLSIQYGGDLAANLCVTAPAANNMAATLTTCVTTCRPSCTTPTYTSGGYPGGAPQQAQEWSFDDNGHFESAGSSGNLSGLALGPPTSTKSTTSAPNPTDGAVLTLITNAGSVSDVEAMNPDPSVGAGAAAGAQSGLPGTNGQLVNYQEFGRCYDLTGQNPTAAYDIDYPCKQAPDPKQVAFNQRFTFTASAAATASGTPGTLSTSTGGTTYCMTAPSSPSTNNVVAYSACTGASTGASNTNGLQQWVFTQQVQGDYDHSYTITNGGLCLSLGGAGGTTGRDSTWSSVQLDPCDFTGKQKWNAPARPAMTSLSGVAEQQDH